MDFLRKQSPFGQVLLLVLVGIVSTTVVFMILSVLFSLFPSSDESVQNMQRICLSAIPFGVGLFLVPGIMYARISTMEKAQVGVKNLTWSLLVFVCGLGALTFLAVVNKEIIVGLGFESQVEMLDQLDSFFSKLFGPTASTASFVLSVLLIGVVTGICEEMAFRRFLFHHLYRNTKKLWLAIVLSSFIFAILHFNYIQLIPMFFFGVLFALVFFITKSVWVSAALHALNNILSICVVRFDIDDTILEQYHLEIAIPSILLLTGLMYLKRKELFTKNQ